MLREERHFISEILCESAKKMQERRSVLEKNKKSNRYTEVFMFYDENDVIILNGEDGTEVLFSLLDTIDHEGQEYVFLLPLPDQGEVEDEVYIFRVIEGDTMADEDFEIVEDEALADELYEIFSEKNRDRFTVEKD